MITKDDIQKLALLARIAVTPQEVESFSKEIEAILSYVGHINSVTVPEGTPKSGLINVFREDDTPHESGLFTKDVLQASPNREGEYIKVKKILPSS